MVSLVQSMLLLCSKETKPTYTVYEDSEDEDCKFTDSCDLICVCMCVHVCIGVCVCVCVSTVSYVDLAHEYDWRENSRRSTLIYL